ncbi:hypothetical protein E2I00_007050, partial [Balaenoptera physalus]
AKGQNFMLEDSAFWIFGGSVHYFRVPREYWRDRLLKMKACGLNTLTTPDTTKTMYLRNTSSTIVRGFRDEGAHLGDKLRSVEPARAGKRQIRLLWEPGPGVGAPAAATGPGQGILQRIGWIPSLSPGHSARQRGAPPQGSYSHSGLAALRIRNPWLLQDPDMRLRTTYKGFAEAVDLYFDHLMARVVPLQYKHGGPIIAVQVENEYGSYNKDPAYMPYVKKALEDRGIVELLLTSDNKDGLSKGIVDGALATINLQSQNELQFLTTFLLSVQVGQEGVQPRMVMECWTGWFDSSVRPSPPTEILETVSAIVDSGSSINLYMFHDYDAALTEAGDYTAKYTGLREFFGSISGAPLPAPPDLLPKTAYEPVIPALYLSLWDALPYLEEPVTSEKPLNMENLPINGGNGQSFGYTLYETTITSSGILSACVRDRGQVFVNTVSIGFLDYKRKKIVVPLVQGFTVLRILVENCGRVNYGTNIDDQRKDKWNPPPDVPVLPAFFLGPLLVSVSPCDTFVKLEGWEKGVVFINGRNLGRYWNIGPQETLYLPGEDGSSGQPLPSGPLLRLRDRLAVSPGHCLRGEDGGSGGTVHGNALPGPAPVHELSGPQASRRGGSRPSLLTAGRPAAAPSFRPSPAEPEKRVGGEGGPLPEELPGSVAGAVRLRCSRGRDGGSGWDCPPWGEWGTAPGQSAPLSVPVGPVSELGGVSPFVE